MSELNPILQLGTYRHYKGNEYRVIGIATHSETDEQLVIYEGLYEAGGLWARPLAMFLDTVVVDGVEQPRFAFIAE